MLGPCEYDEFLCKEVLKDFSLYHVRDYLAEIQKGPTSLVLTMLASGSLNEHSRIICNTFPFFINL